MQSSSVADNVRSTAESQIVAAYEEYDMQPDEIAEMLKWDVKTVRIALAKSSPKFQNELRGEKVEDISDVEYKQILNGYKQLALYSEVDSVRERASKTLIGMKKGWEAFTAPDAGKAINIVQINNNIKIAREEARKILTGEIVVKELKE